jgi:hypothetical protein
MIRSKRDARRFSLKRLFLSVTLSAIACAITLQMHSTPRAAILSPFILWVAASIAAGAAVVVLWGFNRRTAWVGVIISWLLVIFLLYGGPPRPKPAPATAPPGATNLSG